MNGLRHLITGDSSSMRNFAKKRGFKDPISLRLLLTMPSEVSSGALHLEAGDVEGWVAMSLFSDGQCAFSGHFHDDGTIFGDHYTIIIIAQHPKIGALVKKKEGSLKAKEDTDWNDLSFDPWVKSNWATLIDGQTTFHCKLDTKWGLDIGIGDLLPILLVLVLLGGAASCFGDPDTTKTSGTDENGNAYASCSW